MGQGQELVIHYEEMTDKAQGCKSRWGYWEVSARKVPAPKGINKSESRSAIVEGLKGEVSENQLNTSGPDNCFIYDPIKNSK